MSDYREELFLSLSSTRQLVVESIQEVPRESTRLTMTIKQKLIGFGLESRYSLSSHTRSLGNRESFLDPGMVLTGL